MRGGGAALLLGWEEGEEGEVVRRQHGVGEEGEGVEKSNTPSSYFDIMI